MRSVLMMGLTVFGSLLLACGSLPRDKVMDEEFRYAIIEGDVNTVKTFLAKGCNPNSRDEEGFSPLRLVFHANLSEYKMRLLFDLLITNGANVDNDFLELAGRNENLLHAAACSEYGYDYFKELIKRGCDIDEIGAWGWTPLHQAAFEGKHNNIVSLIDLGANVNIRSDDGLYAVNYIIDGTKRMHLSYEGEERIEKIKSNDVIIMYVLKRMNHFDAGVLEESLEWLKMYGLSNLETGYSSYDRVVNYLELNSYDGK